MQNTRNHIIKWKCHLGTYEKGCDRVYADHSEKLLWEVRNDTPLPYCTCGHRVYLVVDTGDKYGGY